MSASRTITTKSANVAIYARSACGTEAMLAKAISDQVEACIACAPANWFARTVIYADIGKSGSNISPYPGFVSLLDDVKSRMFEIVIVEDVDRLPRDFRCLNQFLRELNHVNTELISAKYGKLVIYREDFPPARTTASIVNTRKQQLKHLLYRQKLIARSWRP